MVPLYRQWPPRRILAFSALLISLAGCGPWSGQGEATVGGHLLTAPEGRVLPPDPGFVERERDLRERAVLEDWRQRLAAAPVVVEAVVSGARAEPVAREGEGRGTIRTRYRLRVLRAWKGEVGPSLEVVSRGGRLADTVPAGNYPRGAVISVEAYPELGSTILVALRPSREVQGAWRIAGGRSGFVAVEGESGAREEQQRLLAALRKELRGGTGGGR